MGFAMGLIFGVMASGGFTLIAVFAITAAYR